MSQFVYVWSYTRIDLRLRDILRFESYVIGIVAREHHARFARNTTQW